MQKKAFDKLHVPKNLVKYHEMVNRPQILSRSDLKLKLNVICPKKEKVKNLVEFKGFLAWNALTLEHQCIVTYSQFKLKTKFMIH